MRVTSDCRTFHPGQGNGMLIENGLFQDKQHLVCCKDMLAIILYVRRAADRSNFALKMEISASDHEGRLVWVKIG